MSIPLVAQTLSDPLECWVGIPASCCILEACCVLRGLGSSHLPAWIPSVSPSANCYRPSKTQLGVCDTPTHSVSLAVKNKRRESRTRKTVLQVTIRLSQQALPELTGALSVVIKRQSLGIWRSGRTLGGLATSFRIFSLSLYPFLSPSAGGAMLSRYLASSLPNSWQQLYVSQSGKRKAYLLVLKCPDALGCRNCKQPLAVKCPFEILAFIKEVYSPSDWVTIPVANEMIHKKLL